MIEADEERPSLSEYSQPPQHRIQFGQENSPILSGLQACQGQSRAYGKQVPQDRRRFQEPQNPHTSERPDGRAATNKTSAFPRTRHIAHKTETDLPS